MIALLRRLLPRREAYPDLAAMERDLDDALARRKAERLRRAEAARKGVSTKRRKTAQRTREMFGG